MKSAYRVFFRASLVGFSLVGVFLAAFSLVAMPVAANAADVCVHPKRSKCLTTIQAGIDAAVAGDVVGVSSGVYNENVVIVAAKAGLELRARGAVLDGGLPLGGAALTIEAADVTVRGLHLRGGADVAVRVAASAADASLVGVKVVAADADCIEVLAADALIEATRLSGCRGDGISATADGLAVESSRIERVGGAGVRVSGASARILKVAVDGAVGDGISVTGDDGAVVDCRVVNTGGRGVSIVGDMGVIADNRVERSGDDGIAIGCTPGTCTGAAVAENAVRSALGGSGIDVVTDSGGGVLGNSVKLATADGIVASGPGLDVLANRVTDSGTAPDDDECVDVAGAGTTVENNQVERCAGGGIAIAGDGAVVRNNESANTFGDGIDVEAGAGPVVSGNLSELHGGVGLAISQGVTTAALSGNVVRRNAADYCDAGAGTTTAGDDLGIELDPMGGDCPTD